MRKAEKSCKGQRAQSSTWVSGKRRRIESVAGLWLSELTGLNKLVSKNKIWHLSTGFCRLSSDIIQHNKLNKPTNYKTGGLLYEIHCALYFIG